MAHFLEKNLYALKSDRSLHVNLDSNFFYIDVS